MDRFPYLYNSFPDKDKFSVGHFGRRAGSKALAGQIRSGMADDPIRASWQADPGLYKTMRKKYLLYE
ncbi:MAG TPA: hypothetical protein VK658_24415 [Chryseolinea sp.]|nr:hypothetical protein [Chryseolinea sp.]